FNDPNNVVVGAPFGNKYIKIQGQSSPNNNDVLPADSGSLRGPFIKFDGFFTNGSNGSWRPLTGTNQSGTAPIGVALGIGGTGWNGGRRYFGATSNTPDAAKWLYTKATQTPFTIDNNLSGGVGSFTWTGYFYLNVGLNDTGANVTLKLERKYELQSNSSFIKETTTITNIDPENDPATNLRWWTGVEWAYGGIWEFNDPDLLRGNISGGSFAPVSLVGADNQYQATSSLTAQSNAVVISPDYPGVGSSTSPSASQNTRALAFFYSTHPDTRSIIAPQQYWGGHEIAANHIDPASSDSIGSSTNSYALYLPLGDLSKDQSVSFNTYLGRSTYANFATDLAALIPDVTPPTLA
ncbi:MAG: hypothetical protein ACO3CL_09105, partial [Bacteroidia bacterium]